MSQDAIESALDDCFDAIFAPEFWPSAMEALGQSLGALGCCFNPNTSHADRLRLPASPRYRDMLSEFVAGGWRPHDLRSSRGWQQSLAGKPLVFESDCTTAQERRTLPIYTELFARHQLETFVGVGLHVDGTDWSFSLARPETMGGFEHDPAENILRIRPSLHRLLRFAASMSLAQSQGAMAVFSHANVAAVLLDWRGDVAEMNAAASLLMGNGLDVQRKRLLADNPTSNTALQSLIHGVALSFDSRHAGPAYIARPGKSPLIVEATQMSNVRADMLGFPGAALLITDPETRTGPRHDVLRKVFGLTAREADVAHLLTMGCDCGQIAEHLSLRRSSVQQLIKALLAKTGANRQSIMVAMFSRLPAG